MNVQEIYEKAIQMGIDADFRSREQIEKMLERKRQKSEKLSEEDKQEFDQESLKNPYSDTRIIHLAKEQNVQKVMIGIDIGVAEIMLAKQLGIDLIIAHHPLGRAFADLHEVMDLQADKLSHYGVPINAAEALMRERMAEVARGINPHNHWREASVAQILGVNLMCLHTAADNISAQYAQEQIEKTNPDRVEDVLAVLREIGEYQEAIRRGVGPRIFVGHPENRVGKLFVGFTGGTDPSAKIYEKMANAGIGTIVDMHVHEEHRKEAESLHINVLIAGHMSSDSIGMNIIADEMEKQGIEIIPVGGFFRVSRV